MLTVFNFLLELLINSFIVTILMCKLGKELCIIEIVAKSRYFLCVCDTNIAAGSDSLVTECCGVLSGLQ